MTIERTIHGAYKCSAISGGFLVSRTYCGYTKRESERLFREFLNRGKIAL